MSRRNKPIQQPSDATFDVDTFSAVAGLGKHSHYTFCKKYEENPASDENLAEVFFVEKGNEKGDFSCLIAEGFRD